VAALVGHTALRVGCMATVDRPATDAETAAMRAQLHAALQAGAIGLSTGTAYPPADGRHHRGDHRRRPAAGRARRAVRDAHAQ
jgi:N-acyl-D-aspartate/D-glutamate deacylase